MLGHPTTFWGKLEQDPETSEVRAWHPLLAHCADVAACAEALLERTLLRQRLATLAGAPDLDARTVARLSVLAALHDIGKFNRGFQRKSLRPLKDVAGHVAEVLCLFGTDYAIGQDLFRVLPPELADWFDDGGAYSLLVASIGHHGRPVSVEESSPEPSLWRPGDGRDPFAGIASLVTATRAWFPAAYEPVPAGPRLATAPFQHAFSGLVMLADWLGSDRAAVCFPFAENLGDRMPFARARATSVLADLHLDPLRARLGLGPERPGFHSVSPQPKPREAQEKTIDLPIHQAGSLAILESETGSGKTEAALGRFLRLFHAGEVDGMTFALPTRTASTQLFERVVDAMQRAFPDPAERLPVVLAVPGYLQVDDARGRRLPGFEVLWNDLPSEGARHRGWAAEQPKRFLAGAVVVGTIDQVLLSSLRVGHAHLRASALLRHLLVVDEVHASDGYMNRVLEEVLRFHLAAGGHALLMSATLGSFVRARLEAAARPPRASAEPRQTDAASLESALRTPYPAVHDGAVGGARNVVPVTEAGLPKRIEVAVEPLAADPEAIVAAALRAGRAGARVIVLRNTVTDAVATQLALERALEVGDELLPLRVGQTRALHHSRFSKVDREALDDAIAARFGKLGPARGGAIAVATQTVQQSLDLDADLLLTDLAPMDVLLQRCGRVHRHRERDGSRPAGFETARVIVLVGSDALERSLGNRGEARGRHGVGTVYENVLMLEATRRILVDRGALLIPEQNRELVERTTHPAALDRLAAELGAVWRAHADRVGGVAQAHRNLAQLNAVDRSAVFGGYTFRRAELEERIASRLGESNRIVRFSAPYPEGPFGEPVRELQIPGWLARSAPKDPDLGPTNIGAAPGTLRFSFGPDAYRYDRLGLAKEEASPDALATESSDSTDIADA